jgi:hydroxyethylthiazole kinase-like uncharacterized protein yjeF
MSLTLLSPPDSSSGVFSAGHRPTNDIDDIDIDIGIGIGIGIEDIDGGDIAERWPLPRIDESTSKVERGTVLIIGGSTETPGSVILAGIGCLRTGAGRLQIATAAEAALAVGVAVPESRVIALATDDCEIRAAAIRGIGDVIGSADAILLGTGGLDPATAASVASVVLDYLDDRATVVFDAAALAMVSASKTRFAGVADRAVLIPNPTEAGHLLDVDIAHIAAHPAETVTQLVGTFGATVALRMEDTYSAGPGTAVHRDRCGHPALATSGSGDVLAGMLTGLLAQGTAPLTAVIRAVHAHGRAGHAVVERTGGYGILARELLEHIPRELRGGHPA